MVETPPSLDNASSDDDNNASTVLCPKATFSQKSHMTWDNYFSGDKLLHCAATEGFGSTMTVQRGRPPTGVPGKHLHRERSGTSLHLKAARFEQPIVITKTVPNTQSAITLTSFQSTSSCDIACVNAINSFERFVVAKERGRGVNKRTWGIEMNKARQLCLKTHGIVDTIDQMVKNCALFCRSWKH